MDATMQYVIMQPMMNDVVMSDSPPGPPPTAFDFAWLIASFMVGALVYLILTSLPWNSTSAPRKRPPTG